MPYAICRISKLSTWGNVGGSAAHTYRTIETPNADPSRLALNRTGVGTKGDVVGDVRRRIEAVTDRPRKNAVLCIEHLLTASPEWFEGKTQQEIQAWARENVAWLRERYGRENVVHVVLHQDEKTPHLVAYVVPERDGKLNARGIVGGRNQLKAMQTSYAAAMGKFGLERGVEGSKSEHQTVKRFYGKLNATAQKAAEQIGCLPEPEPPPPPRILEGKEARKSRMEEWKTRERGKTRKIVEDASTSALEASQALERERALKAANASLSAEVHSLQVELSAAYSSLGLSKEEISALRRSDVSLVAQRLGFMGEILPKENAIDLVKRVAELNFEQAVAWLHAELGVMGGAMIIKAVQEAAPPRPFTAAENVIRREITRQADALGCDKFRVTLQPADETKKPYLPGKPRGKNSEERFYTRKELADLVPWLRLMNNKGDNVFITPMDDNAYYILLDDMKVSEEELRNRGFQPCIVQSTSWNKQQAVFKVPKDLPREDVLKVFNDLNKSIGDEKMQGLRHAFRLAGFRNMKPQHERHGQRPFVTLGLSINRFCLRCTELVRQVSRQHPKAEAPAERGPLRLPS